MMPKILAKMYRMKMMSDVKDLVESLPFGVAEKQMDHCIYAGSGEVDTGTVKYPTSVHIVRNDRGKLSVLMSSPKAGVREEIPFDTEEQRRQAPDMVQALMLKYLN